MIWEILTSVVALTSPLPIALLLLDGTRKKCPSCGRLWARTMVSTSYTKMTPVDEYMNWKVFFDNHFVGFAPESVIPHPGSPNSIQVFACRFCHEPFSSLQGQVQPRVSLFLKLGLIIFAASLADLGGMLAWSTFATGGSIALEFGAAYLFALGTILTLTGLVLQFVGKEFH